MHTSNDWRTNREIDWKITPKYSEISETGYVGLKNLACSKIFNFNMKFQFLTLNIIGKINPKISLLYEFPNATTLYDSNIQRINNLGRRLRL